MSIIRQAEIDSVQELPDARKGTSRLQWSGVIEQGPFLPAYGTRRRLLWQRAYDRNETNTIWLGASAGTTKSIASIPYEIRGPKGMSIRHWEDLFRNADFGRGYSSLIKKLARDLFRFDIGAWMEVTGPGHPLTPMVGAPTGLEVLDPVHVWPTGDPTYPAFYDRQGALHLMHRTRIKQFVDAPETDENYPGWGLSPLTRAMSFVRQMMLMNRYVNEQLDDTPPSGWAVINNIQMPTVQAAIARMKKGLETDSPDVLGRTIFLPPDFADHKASLEFVAMATPPEKFDYGEYISINVNAVALAMGIDRQELWELSSGGIGTGTQSEVLHAKSRGKMKGEVISTLTREFNSLMPEDLEFEYKFRDADEDDQQAQTRAANYGAVLSVSSALSVDEQRRLLALLDSSAQDVLTDPDGEIISIDDADQRPANDEVVTDDETELTDEQPAAPEETEETETPTLRLIRQLKSFKLTKDFATTSVEFANTFVNVMSEGDMGEINRRRFSIIMRNELRRFGRAAYMDGLEQGGVNRESFDNEDHEQVLTIAGEEGKYLSDLGATLYKDGIGPDEMRRRAAMWINKSLRRFLYAGVESAARNGTFGWALGRTEKHCRSCKVASGKVAKFKTWMQHDIRPGSSRLFCGGFKCGCSFFRTNAKVTGGISRIPLQ